MTECNIDFVAGENECKDTIRLLIVKDYGKSRIEYP